MIFLIADAVFEGGGVKGIGIVGALCCLEERGYKWDRVAGTSAGAIIAALVAVGYKAHEIKKIMLNINYRDFLDKDSLQSIPLIGGIAGFLIEKGIYSGNKIENWVNSLLMIKGKKKFKDVSVFRESRLKIIASDITNKEILILPDDLKKYGIDEMEFEISKAVRMSIGIPFYYKPYKLKSNEGISYIVDGGILSNYPIWIFDSEDAIKKPTIGFKLIEPKTDFKREDRFGIANYALDIIKTMMEGKDSIHVKEKDFLRTIPIPTLGVKTTEFDISNSRSLKLFNSGYNSGMVFLNNRILNNIKK